MKRAAKRVAPVLLLSLIVSSNGVLADECDVPEAMVKLLEDRAGKKNSVTLTVGAQRLPILVSRVAVDDCVVEGRNQQHDRILIRLDRIAAAATS